MTPRVPIELFADWLANGKRGLSSNAIVHALTGKPVGSGFSRPADDYPRDPSDLRRCVLLLDQYPWARQRLGLVADLGPTWAALVDHWDELEELLSEEQALKTGKAPRTYRRMDQIIREAQS